MAIKTQTQAAKASQFLKFHKGPGALVLANVWDVASARLVEQAGFRAVATSSAGIAYSLGCPDGEHITRTEMLMIVERIAGYVGLPVTADLEAGYGASLEDVNETARGMIAAGAVGLNFEDATGEPGHPLFDVELQADRVRSIREVAASAGVPVVINARTDVFLLQIGDPSERLEHAIRRLNAYRRAGADCLFAPGVRDRETIAALVRALEGPLNILASPATPPMEDLERLGVARISFGSWPMRASYGLFLRFARELRNSGTYAALGDLAIPYDAMNKLFRG